MLNPTFAYLDDNHTSVIGMRRIVAGRGADVCCVTTDKMAAFLASLSQPNTKAPSVPLAEEIPCDFTNSLFAYPAQSNFSGVRYPLTWIEDIHERSRMSCCVCGLPHQSWFVLLDAAALLTTTALDLESHKPDFVVLSFYKMFGFPSGLGMLLQQQQQQPFSGFNGLCSGTTMSI